MGDYVTRKEIQKYLQENQAVQWVSYGDLLQIYGCEINYFNTPKMNKKLTYLHFQYYNRCYDQMWYYKWTPVLLHASSRLVRLRPVWLVLPIVYVHVFDHMFYQYFLYSQYPLRNINIAQSFTQNLGRPQYRDIRHSYFQKYLGVVQTNTQQGIYQDFSTEIDDPLIFGSKDKLQAHLSVHADHDILDAPVHPTHSTPVLPTHSTPDSTPVPRLIHDLKSFLQWGTVHGLRERIKHFLEFKRVQTAMPKHEHYMTLLQYDQIKASSSKDIYLQINNKFMTILELVNYVTHSKYTWLPFNTKYQHEFYQPKINIPSNRPDIILYGVLIWLPIRMLIRR